MAIRNNTTKQRIIEAGRDSRRVRNSNTTMSPFGGLFNALRPLIQ